MEQVGSQIRLPFRRAFQIALQGIRIRFGRSLVTVSGVVLGIAFLMSNLTGQLIQKAVARESALRDTVNLMLTLMRSEVGAVSGKKVAIVVFGTSSEAERLLIVQILAGSPAEVRANGVAGSGMIQEDLDHLGDGTDVMLVLGDGKESPVSLSALAKGMNQKVVLDSRDDRAFAGGPDASVRRELFFGKENEDQVARLRQEARKEKFRTLWIVAISLLVTVIGVANALLMSVTERFREIGTMKCLGALSSFIRRLFLIESSLIGLAGSLIGVVVGVLLPMVIYGFVYQFSRVFGSMPYAELLLAGLGSMLAGTILAMLAAIYPARFASRMVPASALRSTI